ncbi:MAG: hypothetical protein CMJ78_23450 [Planctomycetaceae bacterium]|nr:hypothetical protein [Planctomycetaceae bacterium]
MRQLLFGTLCLSFASLGHAQEESATQRPLPTREEISASLKEWRESFVNVKVEWHSWPREELVDIKIAETDKVFKNYYMGWEFLWADTGGFAYQESDVSDGVVQHRIAMGGDSERTWFTRTKLNKAKEGWEMIEIDPSLSDRPMGSNITLDALYGIWFGLQGRWVDAILTSEESVTVEGWEEIDGNECVIVKVHRKPDVRGADVETLWLDPSRDYLPRQRLEEGYFRGRDTLSIAKFWRANRFRKLNETTWFPSDGYLCLGSKEPPPVFMWQFKEVEFNTGIDSSRFQPPKGVEGKTRVIDHISNTVTLFGNTPSKSSMDIAGADPTSLSGRSPITAKASDPINWRLWLSGFGVLSLCVAVVVRQIRLRSFSGQSNETKTR